MLITNWVGIFLKNSAGIAAQEMVALYIRTDMTNWGKIECLSQIRANHYKLGPTQDTLLVLKIWSHLLKKPLMENFVFCTVFE